MRTVHTVTLALLASTWLTSVAGAQFTPRFRTNLQGDMYVLANGIVTCDRSVEDAATCDAVESETGVPVHNNDDISNAWIDVDADPDTFNSSAASLSLPAGAAVEWAGLYWYGNSDAGDSVYVPPVETLRNEVLLDTPATDEYVTVESEVIDTLFSTRFMAFAEVSELVRTGGNGTYTVANIDAIAGADDHVGGWMLIVIARDDDAVLRHFSVFDGRESYGGGSDLDIVLDGFLTPTMGEVDADLLFVALDGDAGSSGNARDDSVEFTPDDGIGTTTTLFNALNPADDFGNSTITYRGSHLAARTPSYRNTLGFDVDLFDVSDLLANNVSSATATFSGDGSETNDAVTAAFKTTIYAPQVEVVKTLSDLNGEAIREGDVLEYTVTVTNDALSLDNAVNVSLQDILPSNTTYVAGSTELLITPPGGPAIGPLTDAAGDDIASFAGGVLSVNLGVGADDSTAGQLDVGESTSLSFRVTVNDGVAGEVLSNQAEVTYEGETLVDGGASFPVTSLSRPPVGAGPTTGSVGSDDDGLPDDEDPDDDNDGILDIDESPGFPGDPGDDQDSDGIPAWKDPDEVPGGCPDDGGTPARCTSLPESIDGDQDGVPNHLDRDADGDGIPDTVESGSDADSDGDGLPDDTSDSDGDGVIDAYDAAPNDAGDATSNVTARDTGDGDGIPDFRDRDSDGDGLTDAYEAGYDDDDGDGIPDDHVDADGDGLNDTLAQPRTTNSEQGSEPDYVAADSDGDGTGDNVEAFDSDGDGSLGAGETAPAGADADGDGIDDAYDPDCPGPGCAGGLNEQVNPSSLTAYQDADGDGTADWLQVCGDGYVASTEACDDGNDVDADACSNACLAGDGADCDDSSDCVSGACHDDTGTCESCTDDSTGDADTGCSDPTPVCVESGGDGACVACEDDRTGGAADDGCSGATPLCDPDSSTCVGCLDSQAGDSDLGCTGSTPVCDASAAGGLGSCVACEDDESGTTPGDVDFGCDGDAPFCDDDAGTCLVCLNDGHCSDDGNDCTTGSCNDGSCDQEPVAVGTSCDADGFCDGAGSCEDCINNASGQDQGCGNDAPFCEADDNQAGDCVECLTDDDCGADERCDASGSCRSGCDSDADCDDGDVCDASADSCVPCLDTEDDAGTADRGCDDATPVCNAEDGAGCVECQDDADCGGLSCDVETNTCVACSDTGDGTDEGCDEGFPLCVESDDGGRCVQCLSNDDCDGGAFCDAQGACVEGCDDDDDCDNQVCDTESAACVTCVDDSDDGEDRGCNPDAPLCDTDERGGECAECLEDGDCDDGHFCEEGGRCERDPDADRDDDGVPDVDECPDLSDCPDTDDDGTPDFMDPDDDGDGVPTEDECRDASDCPDSDGDGTPDFMDPDPGSPADLSGSFRGGAGCSAGGDAPAHAAWLGGLLLALTLRRRRSGRLV